MNQLFCNSFYFNVIILYNAHSPFIIRISKVICFFFHSRRNFLSVKTK